MTATREESRDERRRHVQQTVVAAVIKVAPELSDGETAALLETAGVASGKSMGQMANHLADHPDALTTGDPRCPLSLVRLAYALHEGGHTAVVRPACAGCGKITVKLNQTSDAGRTCGTCAARNSKRTCARCGRTARIAARRADGGICFACYNTDPGVVEPCGQCGRVARPTTRLPDGSPLCATCWSPPTHTCIGCGQVKRAWLTTTDGPVCQECYPRYRSRRKCGQCRCTLPIKKRATPDNPDLCGHCHRGPEAVCSACGRTRPRRRGPNGTWLCQSCAPQSRDTCCRCDRIRVVKARWPIGPVCHTCYLAILNTPSECPRCQAVRPLVGLGTNNAPICGPCAGLAADYTCTRCGHSGNPYGAGLCARCVLADRLHDLLAGPNGMVSLQLQPVHQAFAAAERPRSLIYWLARSPNAALLAQLAATGEPLSHERLDELPPGRHEYYVRQLLVTTGVLPERHDDLERLPTWLDKTLDGKPAEHTRLIQPFSHWFLLRRARRRAAARRQPAIASDYLRTQIRVALALLAWLDERDLALADLDQLSLDAWLAGGNTNNYNVRNFLLWAASRGIASELIVPLRPRQEPDRILDEHERWNLLRRCLNDATIPLDTRAAAALVLLFGLPISRIRHLTIDQLDTGESGSFLRTGRHPLLLPPKLASLLAQLADTPYTAARLANTHNTARWLFPGLTPGRPTSAPGFTLKLRALGLDARTARNAALISLAHDLPVPILADVLGLHTTTAERWAHLAKHDWTAYIAERVTDTDALPRREE
ncbi:MAG: hypothetical protein ACRDRO_06100 [Pseudonocardiaceae bacterium]